MLHGLAGVIGIERVGSSEKPTFPTVAWTYFIANSLDFDILQIKWDRENCRGLSVGCVWMHLHPSLSQRRSLMRPALNMLRSWLYATIRLKAISLSKGLGQAQLSASWHTF
jgi:hypothetical protein